MPMKTFVQRALAAPGLKCAEDDWDEAMVIATFDCVWQAIMIKAQDEGLDCWAMAEQAQHKATLAVQDMLR